jgi:hypothetical protein
MELSLRKERVRLFQPCGPSLISHPSSSLPIFTLVFALVKASSLLSPTVSGFFATDGTRRSIQGERSETLSQRLGRIGGEK